METVSAHSGEFFMLFSNCRAVKGARRSVVVDLQREDMFFIPNDLFDLLDELKGNSYRKVLQSYDDDSIEYLNEFIDFLKENELGFWTDTPEYFPDLSLDWDAPSIITNAIIDVKPAFIHPWKKIFEELDELGCKDLQLRFYDYVSPPELSGIIDLLDKKRIKSVEIILKYDSVYSKRLALSITKKYQRIRSLFFHSSPIDDVFKMSDGKTGLAMGNIVYLKQCIDSNDHCGIIASSFFSFTLGSFSEAQQFNSCLNRKVSIDYDGNIKNCPTLKKTYGNINTKKISEVLNADFHEIWNINKDQINVCRDCEFRYVCTDCRGFLDNFFDKPKKCTYDPYSAKWNN